LIVASRPGQPLDDLRAALPQGLTMEPATGALPALNGPADDALEVRSFVLRNSAGETAPFYLLPDLHIDISASQIRDLIRDETRAAIESSVAGQQLLPVSVLNYIRTHELYR
jgi:nicotinic acid mononucleotide adenylyltransferase